MDAFWRWAKRAAGDSRGASTSSSRPGGPTSSEQKFRDYVDLSREFLKRAVDCDENNDLGSALRYYQKSLEALKGAIEVDELKLTTEVGSLDT